MRHADARSGLQLPQQNTRVNAAGSGERWRLDLSMQPDQRLGFRIGRDPMSSLTLLEECKRKPK
jgi:hypothetical protein